MPDQSSQGSLGITSGITVINLRDIVEVAGDTVEQVFEMIKH